MTILITIISNIAVLVSHNIICFGYFIPMSHGVNKKSTPITAPPPLLLTGFSPGLLVGLQEMFYKHFFALIRLL